MNAFLVTILSLTAAPTPTPAADREWPFFKGNAGFSGGTSASIKPPLRLQWSYRLDGDASGDAGAGVVVAGNKVFVNVNNTGSILALDAHSGQFLWEYQDSAVGYKTVPSYAKGLLVLWERQKKGNRVLALDAANGKLRWEYTLKTEGMTRYHRVGLPVWKDIVYCSEGGKQPSIVALHLETGKLKWRTPLDGNRGPCVVCPAVAGGKVFVGSLGAFRLRNQQPGGTYALDAATGKILWRRADLYPLKPMVSDGQVVAGFFGESGSSNFHLLDAQTGESQWKAPGRATYRSSTLTKRKVLIKFHGGSFAARDRRTGKTLWQFHGKTRSGCCTPVVAGEYAYFGTGTVPPPAGGQADVESLSAFGWVKSPSEQRIIGTMHAIDLKTGQSVWQFPTGNTICGDPALAYGRLYFAGRDGKVYCFAPADIGTPPFPEAKDRSPAAPPDQVQRLLNEPLPALQPGKAWPMCGGTPGRVGLPDTSLRFPPATAWKFDMGGRVVCSAAIRDNRVYAGSDAGKIVALNVADGKKIWEFSTKGPVRCTPAVVGDLVYCGSDDGRFHALDSKTGKVRWSFETGGPVQASPAVVGGVVIFGAHDHNLYALNRHTGRKLWSFRTNHYCIQAPPVVHGDSVYVGQWRDWIWALDLKSGKPRWRSFVPVSIEALAFHREKLYVRSPYYVIELDPASGKRLRIGVASYGHGGLGFRNRLVFQSGVKGQYGTAGATRLDLDAAGTETSPRLTALKGVRMLARQAPSGWSQFKAMTTPLVLKKNTCFALRDGRIVVAAGGKTVCEMQLGGACHSSPVTASGLLVVGSDDGFLYAFREK